MLLSLYVTTFLSFFASHFFFFFFLPVSLAAYQSFLSGLATLPVLSVSGWTGPLPSSLQAESRGQARGRSSAGDSF